MLEYRPGQGLYVTSIKWTEEGAQRLLARAQRYISPAFRVDESGRVTELANVALTALPAMRNLSPLIAANVTKGRKMPEELLSALGLAPDASLDEALGKISELMQGMAAAAEAADTAAEEMAEQASAMTDEEKLAAIMAEEDEEKAMSMLREYRGGGKTDDGEDVAASLAARVARVEKSEASRVIAANASRMTPAQREYAKGLELASLNAFVAALPSGPALPGPPPRRPTGGRAAHKLDESALLVANATGVNAKDIVAHRAAYQEKMARRAGKVSK